MIFAASVFPVYYHRFPPVKTGLGVACKSPVETGNALPFLPVLTGTRCGCFLAVLSAEMVFNALLWVYMLVSLRKCARLRPFAPAV
jgi:hypothetical protein